MIVLNSKSKSARELQKIFNTDPIFKEINYDILLCWGRSSKLLNMSWDVIINSATIGINKFTELEILKENKVKLISFNIDFKKLNPENLILGRTFWHKKGKEINIYDKYNLPLNNNNHNKKEFYTEYVKTINEYRIHIIGEFTRVFEKTQTFSNYPQKDNSILIRNAENGYKLKYLSQPPKGIRPLAKQAIIALNLDFGVIDMLETETGYIVLEVNTCPLLSENNIKRYTKFFYELFMDKIAIIQGD